MFLSPGALSKVTRSPRRQFTMCGGGGGGEGGSHIKVKGVLVGFFESDHKKVPRSCFVGVVPKLILPLRARRNQLMKIDDGKSIDQSISIDNC